MIPDLDIWRAAQVMVKRYEDNALKNPSCAAFPQARVFRLINVQAGILCYHACMGNARH